MVDFNERLKKISANNQRRLAHRKQGEVWPIEKRLEVVSQFLLLGNMKVVAAMTGVDYDLCRKWKTQAWWPEMVAEVRATQNIKTDTTLTEIIEKSLEAAYDRIVNGDYIYDQKTGEIKRRPAALRDIHRVAVDLLGKREFLRDKAEASGDHKQTSVEEHLSILANNMSQWFEKQKKPVIDLEEVEDAVYEEREAGLQEGSSPVHLETGSEEEAGGAERSPSGNGESGQSPQG